MKKVFFALPVAILTLSLSAFTVANIHWNIDPNYAIKFKGGKAEGTFSDLKGKITFDPADLAHANMDVQVQTATIKTGNSTKDEHAKGSSWFDAAKYPTIRFQSTSFSKSGAGFAVNGDLTLHGVTKAVTIPFQFSSANGKGVFAGNFNIKRKDFGINGNSFGFLVGNDFAIDLRVLVNQ